MTESFAKLLTETEASLPELERERVFNAFANDIFEAVDYWRDLGLYVAENNTRVNYPEIAQGQLLLLAELRELLQRRSSEERRKYAPILDNSEKLLQFVKTVQPPKDGHLGVLRVIRDRFQFLQADHNFAITDTEPTGIRFSSGAVYLKLECIENPVLSCSFGPESNPVQTFWINDLLFLNRDFRYRELPDELRLDTQREVESWFGFLASIFKQYGTPVLTNEPGVFTRLVQAQAERDAEYVHEMNLKFGVSGQRRDGTT
jgi:hypothetical protein